MTERIWTGLSAVAADGRACVICGRRGSGWVSLPVGRSDTGSQVLACEGACAERATAPGAVLITEDALTAAGLAFLTALESSGGDLHRAGPDDLVTAIVTAAAPLIVAAELRRLANGPQVHQWEIAVGVMATALPVADLTARADLLDPAGGERR
jgi:hypothetical protein